jgi:O-antigen ligase
MPPVNYASTTASGTLPVSVKHVRPPLSMGMVFLLLFVMVFIGRIQEAIPVLAPLRVALITGGLAFLIWLVRPGSIQEKIPIQYRPVKYVLMLLGLGLMTIPISLWPGGSFEAVTQGFSKSVLLFLLVLYWSRSIPDVRRILWACCLSTVGLVVSALLAGRADVERFNVSTTYDPNDLALTLVIAIPLILYLFSASRHGLMRLVLIGMAFVSLYGIMLTQSRGGFLALLVVGGLILWRGKMSRTSKLAAMAFALVVFGIMAGQGFWERIETIWDPKTEYDRTYGGRSELWKTGLKLMAIYPLGTGMNTFTTAEGMTHGGMGKWSAAHNSFLEVGVELGVAGLVIYLLLLMRTFKQLRRIQSLARAPDSSHGQARKSSALGNGARGKASPGVRPVTDGGSHKGEVAALASALEISLWGFVVGGFLLSFAYSAFLYLLLALSVACVRLQTSLYSSSMQASKDRLNKS